MKDPKRQQIIDRAIDLFALSGLSKVSFTTIAKTFGGTKGMVYHYFPTGKDELVKEVLKIFEKAVSAGIPDRREWESKDADVKSILFRLFFEFPAGEMLRLRKISRIIMAEMYHNEQMAEHAKNHLLDGRERILAECFTILANNGKIMPLDADSVARCLNRLVLAYGMEDALRYPFDENNSALDEQTARMIRDCSNLISSMITIIL